MASNPASRRNSISAMSWPVFPPRSAPAPPSPAKATGKLQIYDSPSPAPFLVQMSAFDFLLPGAEGISPLPDYAACLPALVDASGDRSIRRGELRSLSLRLAEGLRSLGVRKGDTALVSVDGVEGGLGLMACLAAGVVASPLGPDVDLSHQLQDSGASMALVSPAQLLTFEFINGQQASPIPDNRVIVLTPPWSDIGQRDLTPQRYRTLWDVLADESRPVEAECFNGAAAASPALSVYTPSGRAVTLSHMNVTSQLAAPLELGPGDTVLVAPGAPFIASLLPLALGAAVAHCPGSIVSGLEKTEAAVAWLPPPAISKLLDQLSSRDGEEDELALRTIIASGAALGSLTRRVERALPARILPVYSAAEVGIITADSELAPGLQARLRRADGTDVPAGVNAKGELWLRGPSVATEQHWYKTGDVASVRRGRWTIHGRLDARFNANGTPICPERLEDLLFRHPSVRDAAVGPSNEGVRAYLVLNEGVEGEAQEAQRVMRYVQGRTRKTKWVRSVVFVEGVPRTAGGRIRREALGVEAAGPEVAYEPEKWARM